MAPVTLKTVDGEFYPGQQQGPKANALYRRPKRCHPTVIRDPIRRPRLPRPRDTARARAKDVR
jgi:hypothetical protein